MADVGTENYDQEFTLSLIENDQDTLGPDPRRPRADRRRDLRPVRGMRRDDRQTPAPGPALYEALHQVRASHGEPGMNPERSRATRPTRPIPRQPVRPVLGHRPGGRGLRPVDQGLLLPHGSASPTPRAPVTVVRNVLELQTSYNTGALWGFMRDVPHSSLIFAVLSIVAAVGICYWLFVLGAAADRRLTVALALIMAGALGNCYDRLVARARPRLRPPARRRDQLRLRDLQLRRQHAGGRRRALVLLALRPEAEGRASRPSRRPGLRRDLVGQDLSCRDKLGRTSPALQSSSQTS